MQLRHLHHLVAESKWIQPKDVSVVYPMAGKKLTIAEITDTDNVHQLHDEENGEAFVDEMRGLDWDKPVTVQVVAASELAKWESYFSSMTVAQAAASEDVGSPKALRKWMKTFTSNRYGKKPTDPIITYSRQILNGHHRATAAVMTGYPLLYIDIEELE